MSQPPPKAFISYSHDSDRHRATVLALAEALRAAGIDAWIDRFSPWPAEGWSRWMERMVDEADAVVCVCTHEYVARFNDATRTGVAYEAL